jgi:hypothetical protein
VTARWQSKARDSVNGCLGRLNKTLHDAPPLTAVRQILCNHSLWGDIEPIRTPEGRQSVKLAWQSGESVRGAVLVLCWYRYENTGRWEITAYLS